MVVFLNLVKSIRRGLSAPASLIIAASLGCATATAGPPPQEMPCVLLNAPVNATWAANHTDYWQRKGFAGFLLSGIQDDLEVDVWAVDGDAATKGNEDLLLREVRLANERLVEAGIDRNFVLVPIAPDRCFFADPAVARDTIGRFRSVGVFCEKAGLRGVAIDTRPNSLFYDYRWDGYLYDTYTPSDVERGAREFGKHAVRSLLREHPQAEVLVIAGGHETWGPLWFALFEGMVEGLRVSRDAPMHLLTRETCFETRPGRIARIAERTRSIIRDRFADESRSRWEKRGYVGLGISPLGYQETAEGRAPVAHYPFEAYRLQLAAAKLYSERYVCIEANGPSWWRLAAPEAETYGGLLQNGALMTGQTQPVVENLEAYDVRTPLDGLRRVGPCRFDDNPAYVLLSDEGAEIVFWQGIGEQRVVEGHHAPVLVTDLVTEQHRRIEPENSRLVLEPAAGPIVVGSLPVSEWALPAAVWLDVLHHPSPEVATFPVQFGFVNRTAFDISGALDAVVPTGFAIRPATQPFELESGEAILIDGVVRGKFRPGAPVRIVLRVAITGSAEPVTRAFEANVVPDLEWGARLDGAVRAAPLVTELDGEAPDEVVLCSQAGEVVCINADGSVRWNRRFAERFDVAPAAGRGGLGQPLIATVDHRGTLRVIAQDGRVQWEKRLGARCGQSGPVFAEIDPFPGDEVVVSLDDGRIVAIRGDTQVLWSYPTGPGSFFAVLPFNDDAPCRIFVTCGGASGGLECISDQGQRLWRAATDGPSACPPVIADTNGDGISEVITATASGIVEVWRADIGVALSSHDLSSMIVSVQPAELSFELCMARHGSNQVRKQTLPRVAPSNSFGGVSARECSQLRPKTPPNEFEGATRGQWNDIRQLTAEPLPTVKFLAVAELHAAKGTELLVADARKLHCLSVTSGVLWSAAVHAVARPAVARLTDGSLILVPTSDEGLVALAADGSVLWRDTRSPVPLAAPPVAADLDHDGMLECAYTSTDRAVRVIVLGPSPGKGP